MKVCQALAQVGATVQLWVPGNLHTPWAEMAALYGLSTSFEVAWLAANPSLKRYDFAIAAMRQAGRMKADLIYTWLPQAALLGLLEGKPVVLEVHDRPTGRFGPWLLRKTASTRGHKRLAIITQALLRALRDEFGLETRDGEVVITPNGVDLERFSGIPLPAEARRQLNLKDQLTAVYSGHLYAGRGMDLLLGLARRLPHMQFLWVGGQPAAVEAWREKIQQAGMKNIVLTGFVENRRLPLYQAAGDFLLMPYERAVEGSGGGNSADICSPMKMFEYLACGRVILTSDLPVLREVLHPGNAVFCPPEDEDGWYSALAALLGDPERVRALSRQAAIDAEKYSWRARAEKTLQGFV